ncbi:hypothetical protein BKA64DRAFT_761293 [Cadophora sp. MPI-SDFR-AT-0126]|nr:hypothetical protein BKA64DRAFT_761293 [Leotiomycetes sp. MPI-SDFR-AT-0126]
MSSSRNGILIDVVQVLSAGGPIEQIHRVTYQLSAFLCDTNASFTFPTSPASSKLSYSYFTVYQSTLRDMAPCRFFASGSCTYGVICKNSHEAVPGGRASAWEQPPRAQNGSAMQTRDSKEPCWFFSQGTCTYGASCRKAHDLMPASSASSSNPPIEITSAAQTKAVFATNPAALYQLPVRSLKPDVQPFVPTASGQSDDLIHDRPEIHLTPCIFYAKGYCRNGSECAYSHDGPVSHPSGSEPDEARHQSTIKTDVDPTFKDIHGASAAFSAGAQVSSIKLASDFSTIQILGMSAGAGQNDVRAILSGLGYLNLEATITVKQIGGMGAVAEVRVENPAFATEATNKFQSRQKDEQFRKLSLKSMIGSSATGTLGNRLQLSTVSCSWYQASCVAWLTYPSHRAAEAVLRRLQSTKIRGRVPDCLIQESAFRSSTSTLQLGNLVPGTKAKDICSQLSGTLPKRTTIGDPSYDLSNDIAASIVREKLAQVGALESFKSKVVDGSNKMKALAVFVDRESATKAVRKLHNLKMSELGHSKLFLNHVVSVKYNVLSAIVVTLKAETDLLRSEFWTKSHARLEIYPQEDRLKKFTTLRLYGEGHKNIADAKVALESLLAGSVVMADDSVLWNSYFAQEVCLSYLQELNKTYSVYIHRDIRMLQLRIYGGTETNRIEVQKVLKNKVTSLEICIHKIILTPALLEKAMRGGMKRLKARFGSSVKLDVSLPKTISITGSIADFQEAKALLDTVSDHGIERDYDQVESECVVCWSEDGDPLKLTCGHIYCRECFNNQASANDGSKAIMCAEKTCGYILEMRELKLLLSHTSFESLRQVSFEAYVRAHPKSFQYCPTPDCPQLYGPTDFGTAVLCTHCLMSICTSCKVVYHDGMSCEEYKDLSSEGTKAFERYMKESDTRKCPECSVAIQKTYGCNHMECANCKNHFCWECMKVFRTSNQCYGHLQQTHGNYGLT